jgi:4-amino-4-deoxy-L-arabinose transferase-like glycosyltransferase
MNRTTKIHKVKKLADGHGTVEVLSPRRETTARTKLPAGSTTMAPHAWSPAKSRTCLFVLTLLCLLPFVGKAFHIDDTLFVWAAKHIVEHPLDPYGFPVVWYDTGRPMSVVMKNPPLAAYYGAAVGSVAGWSEYTLHLAFFLPALAVVLGVYQLAVELTRSPLLAGVITLVTPGFLVSCTSIMSDVPMLALWMIAIILWRWGLEEGRAFYLASSSLVIGACALTKYFGVCLIPLLLLYSLWKRQRLGSWMLYLLIPVAILGGYQEWTGSLYGHGLLSDVAAYVNFAHVKHPMSFWGASTVGLTFVGGCTLPALICIPWLWRRTFILGGCVAAAIGAAAAARGWFNVGSPFPKEHEGFLVVQLLLFIAGGISVLALAVSDVWRRRDADSVFLATWVAGTFMFAAYLNWTVNSRSVLPLIPAAAILIVRRLDGVQRPSGPAMRALIAPLVVSGLLSLWVARGDTTLANSAREAAQIIHNKTASQPGRVFFSGHWGFQYYMQSFGAQPLDLTQIKVTSADLIVQPENNTNVVPIRVDLTSSSEVIELPDRCWMATMCIDRAAGFYTSFWGVMPFTLGSVPDERYNLVRLLPSAVPLFVAPNP